MRTTLLVALASVSLCLSAGCARTPTVSADGLPLRRVVIYRNGVGYFERAGTVRDSEVHFKMKESEVGDFLASFAVLERGGSSVRSASFPIRLADDEPIRPPVATEAERRGLRKVVLGLDGKSHDLQVGYIVAAPLWRPSYRLVLGAGGMAELQAWGVVENLSGEDWKGVKLSLVAGAPIAFESTLGQPVVPSRPMVTDTGEVMLAVPKAEVALASDAVAAPAPSASPASAEMPVEGASAEMNAASSEDDGSDGERPMRRGPGRSAASKSRAKKAEMAADSARTGGRGGPGMGPSSAPMAAAASAMAVPMSSTPRSLASLAAMVSNGSVTRFDMPNPVTVPDRTATMVMLLARSIPGEAIFLFAPDGAVETSSQHPYRVVRFSNRTGGGLEKGPIAVFESDAFLGQGVVEALPDGANTMVPFALERSIAIDRSASRDEVGARVAKIELGELTIERDGVTKTTYRLVNGGRTQAKILVRHPRIDASRLFQPPPGTEDNVGTGTALVPVIIDGNKKGELVVDERLVVRRGQDWFSPTADEAVRAYVKDPRSDRAVVAALTNAWALRSEVVSRTEARQRLAVEQSELSRSAEETRRSLRAVEKNKKADALRAKLTARLEFMTSRLDDLARSIIEADGKLAELRVGFRESIRDIKLTVTPAPSP